MTCFQESIKNICAALRAIGLSSTMTLDDITVATLVKAVVVVKCVRQW